MALPEGSPRSLKRLWAYLQKHSANIESGGGEAGPVTWADVAGKPATFPPTVGTTAATAAAGNHTHTAATVTVAAGSDGLAAGNVQTQLQALATRIAAPEGGAG